MIWIFSCELPQLHTLRGEDLDSSLSISISEDDLVAFSVFTSFLHLLDNKPGIIYSRGVWFLDEEVTTDIGQNGGQSPPEIKRALRLPSLCCLLL